MLTPPLRHWQLATAVFVTVNLLTLVGTLLMPQSHNSAARLAVGSEFELRMDPTADGQKSLPVDDSGEGQMDLSMEQKRITIAGQRKELEIRLGELAGKLLINDSDMHAAETKIASLKQSLEQLPATIVTQKVAEPNAALDGMRQKLRQTEARERELSAKMQDSHPLLLAARQEVADLRAKLADQPIQRLQSTETANPARQATSEALAKEQSAADSLRGQGRELVALRDRLQLDLQELNSQVAEANQQRPPEQARVNPALDEVPASSLGVVQPASNNARSTGPEQPYVLALGFVVALLSGLGAARIAAYFDPGFVSLAELTGLLDLPLVGRLPRGVFQPPAQA
jgi:uncharacterized protein involved in exopolysaccharide biosynthesis